MRYRKVFSQTDIYNWLKDKKGNLNQYQKIMFPDMPFGAIHVWMSDQDQDFRDSCRALYPPAMRPKHVERFFDDVERIALIHNQKRWREEIKDVSVLPRGING